MKGMSALRIIINSKEDAAAGKSMLSSDKPRKLIEGKMSVGILEEGTKGGNTSIMFITETDDQVVIGQMTLKMLEATLSAAKGADLKFKELAAQRINKS